jgi:hypothetical protein
MQFGHTVNARANLGPGGILIRGLPEKSNPKAHKAWRDGLDEAVRTGSRDWNMQLRFSIRHSQMRESVGWLRVAYLYAFVALGYRFIMRPELERIRDQIRRPDESVARQVMKHVDPTSEPGGISFVHEPEDFRSILVRIGRNLFFFPEFDRAQDFYERLEKAKGTGQKLTLSGVHMDLPRQPTFAFDYEPALMLRTIPLLERAAAGRDV